MSRHQSLSSPFLLGFDEIERVLDRISKSGNDGYPPYNIERLAPGDGNSARLRIILAVAGFARDDLDITVEAGQLLITGQQGETAERDFLHRGIATRQFRRAFVLADGFEVTGADLKNGLLSVEIVRPEPAHDSHRIDIRDLG
ncbi:MAG: Hsp20 family protein [Pseudomonadota bacterium]